MYQMCMRDGFMLPKKGCAFVSVPYLNGVARGVYWTPTHANNQRRNCVTPPPKKEVLAEVVSLLTAQRKTLGDTSRGLPDLGFLLDCLATLKPDHLYFQRDYVAPPVRRPNRVVKELVGLDGFFAGQPPASKCKIKRPNMRTYNRLLRLQEEELAADGV